MRKRPADDVPEAGQREPETCARPALERQHRMRSVTGEPSPRPLVGKVPLAKYAGRREARPQPRCESARAQPAAELTKVASASTSVPPAVASAEIVTQSAASTRRSYARSRSLRATRAAE